MRVLRELELAAHHKAKYAEELRSLQLVMML
jgi:hypothetical protein